MIWICESVFDCEIGGRSIDFGGLIVGGFPMFVYITVWLIELNHGKTLPSIIAALISSISFWCVDTRIWNR